MYPAEGTTIFILYTGGIRIFFFLQHKLPLDLAVDRRWRRCQARVQKPTAIDTAGVSTV